MQYAIGFEKHLLDYCGRKQRKTMLANKDNSCVARCAYSSHNTENKSILFDGWSSNGGGSLKLGDQGPLSPFGAATAIN